MSTIDGASITVPSTAGPAAPGTSVLTFNNTSSILLTGGVTTTVYTPPAGKTFYITDIYISGDFTTSLEVKLQFGSVILDAFVKGDTAPLQFPGIESQPKCVGDGSTALQIVWAAAAGLHGSYLIGGFLK